MTNWNWSGPNSRTVLDAVREAPNVTPSPPDFLPSIRGVESGGAAGLGGNDLFGTVPRAALIVDDVARPSTIVNNNFQSLFDVEQVEVLRGPQTTVRGANALAGVYVVKTRDPVHEFEGEAEAGFDWNDVTGFGWRGAGVANLPLADGELAARLVLEAERGSIPIEVRDFPGNPLGPAPAFTDFDRLSEFDQIRLRGKVLYEPDEASGFSALVTGELTCPHFQGHS